MLVIASSRLSGRHIVINSTKNLELLFCPDKESAAKLPRIQVNESQEEKSHGNSIDKFNQQVLTQTDWGQNTHRLDYTPKGLPLGGLTKANEKALMMKSAHTTWKLPRERDLYKGSGSKQRH